MENLMRPNADGYIQVAGRRTVHTRPAFAAQTDTLPVIDTGGNIDFHRLDRLIPPRATAFDARFFNVFARTVAGRTSLLHTENRLLDVHRTRTFASRAGFRGCPRFRATAVTDITRFISRNIDAFLHTFCGFFKRDFDTDLNVLTLIIRLGAPRTASKHLAENIPKVKTLRTAKSAKPSEAPLSAAFKRRMTILVVHSALFLVGQSFIRLLYFFKLLFRLFIVRIAVGMVFHCQFPVGFFNLIIGSCSCHTQRRIKILITHFFI
ncbi:hypothetical protein NM95_2164 [Neisseria meningitidis NM95]|nr:hypothetical protein NM95_2164 [Neisseria meningitidis NM95]